MKKWKRALALGLSATMIVAASMPAFAGAIISLVPMFILYIFGQKYFVEGMASSGLKG